MHDAPHARYWDQFALVGIHGSGVPMAIGIRSNPADRFQRSCRWIQSRQLPKYSRTPRFFSQSDDDHLRTRLHGPGPSCCRPSREGIRSIEASRNQMGFLRRWLHPDQRRRRSLGPSASNSTGTHEPRRCSLRRNCQGGHWRSSSRPGSLTGLSSHSDVE